MITRMGGTNSSMMGAGIFSPTSTYGSMKYYCMSCGTQHKKIACPKCGSRMKTEEGCKGLNCARTSHPICSLK